MARELLYDDEVGRCNLADLIAMQVLKSYMKTLKVMVFDDFERLIVSLQRKAQVLRHGGRRTLDLKRTAGARTGFGCFVNFMTVVWWLVSLQFKAQARGGGRLTLNSHYSNRNRF